MRGFYFFILLCFTSSLFSQTLKNMAKASPVLVEEVSLSSLSTNQLYISTPFAKPIILNPEQKSLLQEKVILKIELVYTRFRTSPTFSQELLNHNRLKELKKIAPEVFQFPLWEFQLTEQTKGSTKEYCNKMFHGFIVTFRPNSSKNTLTQEATYLTSLVESLLKQDSINSDSLPKKYILKTHFDNRVGYLHDTIWFIDTVKSPSPPDFFYNQNLYKDSTVLNVFERNKDWNNFVVVTDVTGSMSPYSAQVFVWLKAQAENKKANYFVFFNDGDEKESKKKKPLETKGIYVTENKGIDAVIKTATKCMERGSGGGENMENDVEAIIEGIKYSPKTDAIILVADNKELMRDYKFIDKIKKPVHVILCGTTGWINIQYLDLARQTGGSVHTSKSDIYHLENIKPGEKFFIDEREYLYQNNQFHAVYESFKYQNKTVR
jgi:hypothetical protein